MKRAIIYILIGVVLASAVASILFYGLERESPATHVFTLDCPAVRFELPKGYGIYQQEGFEGGYGSTVYIGKEIAEGHLMQAPVSLRFAANAMGAASTEAPSEKYIEQLFQEYVAKGANPRDTTLFGNKAFQYQGEADGNPVITGYIAEGQQKDPGSDFECAAPLLVTVSGQTYGSGLDFDSILFEKIVSSLVLR